MANKLPAFQFYPADWRKDPAIQSLSFHDRAVVFETLCIMHESSERGKLLLNGKSMSLKVHARLLGCDEQTLSNTLSSILESGALKRDANGVLLSSRMVRDEETRKQRVLAGKRGGNPILLKCQDKVPDIPHPPPLLKQKTEEGDEDEVPALRVESAERRGSAQPPAVEFPPGFPSTEEQAVQWAAGKTTAVPDQVRQFWREASCRGGTDGIGQPIRVWATYCSIRASKESNRAAERKFYGNGNGRPAAEADHSKGF